MRLAAAYLRHPALPVAFGVIIVVMIAAYH
jgi:hypothetical protein